MYITGTVGNFMPRIHQIPSSGEDIDIFIIEGNAYLNLNLVTANLSGQWEKELRKRKYLFTHNPGYLTIQQLGADSGGPVIEYILDENGNIIFDELGSGIIQEG